VVGYEKIDGKLVAIDGRLIYRVSTSMTLYTVARKKAGSDMMKLYFFCCSAGFREKKNWKGLRRDGRVTFSSGEF